jgi:hypothetical protein
VKGKGDGKNFDPASDVTVAEAITMAFRISRDPETSADSELCSGKYVGHWGNHFLAWAESKNLSIVSRCTDVNRPALRWEVAQILLEALGKTIDRSEATCFKDVKPKDQPTNSVVCAAQAAGILKGSDGKANPYGKIIRAEVAAMVKKAAEAHGFKFEDFGGEFEQRLRRSGDDEEEFEFGEEEEEYDYEDEDDEDYKLD